MLPNAYTYNPQFRHEIETPTPPTLDYTVALTLDGFELALPAPLFGNQEEIQVQRIQRTTRGGTLITHRETNWPVVEIHKVAFDGLTEQQREDILTFIDSSLGLPITYRDYENRSWSVIIVNPNGDISQSNRVCGYTWEVWFQILGAL